MWGQGVGGEGGGLIMKNVGWSGPGTATIGLLRVRLVGDDLRAARAPPSRGGGGVGGPPTRRPPTLPPRGWFRGWRWRRRGARRRPAPVWRHQLTSPDYTAGAAF